ncbi:MAG: glutathione peroxidase [Halomonadaceae bacterium]|nr:MAG: glutathione peroxidase [Halomonadaceae bacterium]
MLHLFRSVALPATLAFSAMLLAGNAHSAEEVPHDPCPALLQEDIGKLRSSDTIRLCDEFAGYPLLVVNTASRCGFTGQFESLEQVHQRFKERGLKVIGVPSNDFRQEASTDEETARVCFVNYGVTFTMTERQQVTGEGAHNLFRHLNRDSGQPPRWNFHKYVVDREGKVTASFDSRIEPDSRAIIEAIEAVL